MKRPQATIQIGKNSISDGTIQLIKSSFTNRENVKISLLKSAGHTKENAEDIAEKIADKLGKSYTYKIVGFTIFMKKWRKARNK